MRTEGLEDVTNNDPRANKDRMVVKMLARRNGYNSGEVVQPETKLANQLIEGGFAERHGAGTPAAGTGALVSRAVALLHVVLDAQKTYRIVGVNVEAAKEAASEAVKDVEAALSTAEDMNRDSIKTLKAAHKDAEKAAVGELERVSKAIPQIEKSLKTASGVVKTAESKSTAAAAARETIEKAHVAATKAHASAEGGKNVSKAHEALLLVTTQLEEVKKAEYDADDKLKAANIDAETLAEALQEASTAKATLPRQHEAEAAQRLAAITEAETGTTAGGLDEITALIKQVKENG